MAAPTQRGRWSVHSAHVRDLRAADDTLLGRVVRSEVHPPGWAAYVACKKLGWGTLREAQALVEQRVMVLS